VDSEVLKSQLEANHFEVGHESQETTPVVVINTCGFIDLAKEESINTILEYAEEKKNGRLEKLYVTGCLSQRYKMTWKQRFRKSTPILVPWSFPPC
jgi:ribosomal protein S12 methylthiotransferase